MEKIWRQNQYREDNVINGSLRNFTEYYSYVSHLAAKITKGVIQKRIAPCHFFTVLSTALGLNA